MMDRVHRLDRIRSGTRCACATLALMTLAWALGCAGALTGIPDLDSPDGRVFAQRCKSCHLKFPISHAVPDPRLRTMAEWQEVLPKMDRIAREHGIPPMTEDERAAILRYLERHSKSSCATFFPRDHEGPLTTSRAPVPSLDA